MNSQATAPKVTKETKNKIRVEFERTDFWTRFRLKYLSLKFVTTVIWVIFRLVLLIGISYVILSPVLSKVFSSFMGREDFVDVTVKYIAKNPTLDIYKTLMIEAEYFEAFFNTLTLSLFCAVLQTFVCCVIAYGFAKFKFKFNNLLFALVIFTMIVPHETLQLSMFVNFKAFDVFGIVELITGSPINLLNTYWPLTILSLGGLGFKNGLYIYMLRQFFRGVPDELEESAYLDGSGVFRTFIQIIIPLSVPMMITVFLFSFSWQWTDMFYTELFFPKTSINLMPDVVEVIPKALETQGFAGQKMYEAAIRNTSSLLVMAPLLVMYLFCQRYLIAGVERSGIVG
ncbi:MAG: carbohydrate ABC transporter permease [Ruminococcaceae bacterium]|nr:carbohydrate ABC transporter permease [Oscillospiraceae bacterium]